MAEIVIRQDGDARCVPAKFGGEVWVEKTALGFDIGVDEKPDKRARWDSNWGCVTLSRRELKALRRELKRVLKNV